MIKTHSPKRTAFYFLIGIVVLLMTFTGLLNAYGFIKVASGTKETAKITSVNNNERESSTRWSPSYNYVITSGRYAGNRFENKNSNKNYDIGNEITVRLSSDGEESLISLFNRTSLMGFLALGFSIAIMALFIKKRLQRS